MYHLATVFPPIKRVQMPLSRDHFMLLLVAFTELGLALETYLSHYTSGTIVPNEWISIIFGVLAGVLLLVAGAAALRNRPLATLIATVTLLSSIVVGLLGAYFHLRRAMLPTGPEGAQISLLRLIWAPPLLGPLTYAMAGIVGLAALFTEAPIDSGILLLPGRNKVQIPLSKARFYFLITGLGLLATLISSVLDHARTDFSAWALWIPVGAGVFGTVAAVMVGARLKPSRADLTTYALAMLLQIAVGMLGLYFHIAHDLTPDGKIVTERFIRGAPFLAPMLFALLGTYGLVTMLDPREHNRPGTWTWGFDFRR